MQITIHDGIKWLHGTLARLSDESCEIEATGRPQSQPFGIHAVLTVSAMAADSSRAVDARACLVRAFQRDGKWRFICRMEPVHARALSTVVG